MIAWNYGITTIPGRFTTTLPLTLQSLGAAGFANPRLFVDGVDELPSQLKHYEATLHNPPLKTFGNWMLALWELYVREPECDRYAIFQDDCVASLGLRAYLEQCDFPERGYWNCYTFRENERNQVGWHKTTQKGLGAVGLVMSNEGVRTLLASTHLVNRPHPMFVRPPHTVERTWKALDGGIVAAMKKAGWSEYCHTPSLLQHIGYPSSMGNGTQPTAPSFRGESFDLTTLIDTDEQSASVATIAPGRKRIGLVGYSCRSGLGELNRQLAKHCDVDTWLVKPHPRFKMVAPPEEVEFTTCPNGRKVDNFVRSVDLVLFCESPPYPNLIDSCKRHGREIVCVPMQEWMPSACRGWPKLLTRSICPTKHAYQQFAHVIPCVEAQWPVDTDAFHCRQRDTCERFLFVNGHGGYKGRKGGDVIRKAIELWHDIPLTIVDQAGEKWPDGRNVNVVGQVDDAANVYDMGDVLLYPASCDGLGLQPMEAAACGMPVISTDGKPWNEFPALTRVAATKTRSIIKRPVDWWTPDAEALVSTCQNIIGKSIADASKSAREWAESRSWESMAEAMNAMIRGEKAAPAKQSRKGRFFFDEALRFMKGDRIVEIGGIRDLRPVARDADGHSTLRWADSGHHVVSVDTNPTIASKVRGKLNGQGDRVEIVTGDGLAWLQNNATPIDLLYLDGPDPNEFGQKFAADCLRAAADNLSPECVFLIDDCDFPDGGKGAQAVPLAVNELGFRIVTLDRQALLVRSP